MLVTRGRTRGDRRRRFAKACDSCRQKKLRCDGLRPSCTRCRSLDAPCSYSDLVKPSTRAQPAKHTSSNTPNTLPDVSYDAQSETTTLSPTRPHSNLVDSGGRSTHWFKPGTSVNRNLQSSPAQAHVESSVALASSSDCANPQETVFGGERDTRYFGPSSGISFVSDGVRFRDTRPSAEHRVQSPLEQGSWSIWTHRSIQSVFERRTYQPLPRWSEALSLVNDYFAEEQRSFPCFHPPTFMALLAQQYSEGTCGSAAGWAAMNAVLAIAQRGRVERGKCSSEDESLAWGYAANALGSVLEILMCNTQLLSVQALLCITWFFIGTPNPQPSFVLAASAVRLAHSIGLHKSDKLSSRNAVQHATQTRVFWIALSLDREICLRTGRPPAQDFYDYQVGFPENSVDDGFETTVVIDGLKFNLFSATVGLTLLQSRIYQKLYSGERPATTPGDESDSIQPLDDQLVEWCATFVPSLDPGQAPREVQHPATLRLYYSYYNCVIVIHRARGSEYWMPLRVPTIPDLSTDVIASIRQCLKAARSVAALVDALPRRWKSFSWDVVSINMNAAVILCANILRQPSSGMAKEDMGAVSKILQHFAVLEEGYRETYIRNVRLICEELYRMAGVALNPFASRRSVSPPGRDVQYDTQTGQRSDQISGHTSATPGSLPATGYPLMAPVQQDGGHPSFEPRIGRCDFSTSWWTQPGQSSLDLLAAQWSFDVLLGGPPIPEACSQASYNYNAL